MIQQHKPDTALHNYNHQRITSAAAGYLVGLTNKLLKKIPIQVYSQLNFKAGYQLALHYTEAAAAG